MLLEQCVTLACLLEVSAPKVGNVHRGADFNDMSLVDFLISATVIAPIIAAAPQHGVGKSIYLAVEATQKAVGTNTNLGTILLLAPLAAVPKERSLSEGVSSILRILNSKDAHWVYKAIQLANPGGMGQVEEHDVQQTPPDDLLLAMSQAADRDLVARQYVEDFSLVLGSVSGWLKQSLAIGLSISDAIVHTQMLLMAEHPDSLIARKCGQEVADNAAARAAGVIKSGSPMSELYCQALADFDFWSRSDSNRRNPGTTADLIAAGLFAALRDKIINISPNLV